MRVPRKMKKAVKYVERYSRPSASGFWLIPYEGFWLIPYEGFVIKGRCTKWKQKCINEARRERRKMLLEEWQRYDGIIFTH